MANITVGEMMEILEEANPNDILVLAKDPDGNGFLPLKGVQKQLFFFVHGFNSTSIGYSNKMRTDDHDIVEANNATPCLVLWPGSVI